MNPSLLAVFNLSPLRRGRLISPLWLSIYGVPTTFRTLLQVLADGIVIIFGLRNTSRRPLPFLFCKCLAACLVFAFAITYAEATFDGKGQKCGMND